MDLREIVAALQARKISPTEAKVLIELFASRDDAAQGPPASYAGAPTAAAPSAAVPATPPPNGSSRRPPATAVLEEEICASLAEVLYLQRGDVDPRKPFVELGLDSVIAVEWTRALNKRYGIALPATRLYDHPTVIELSAYLETQIAGGRPSGAEVNAHSHSYPELPEGGYGLVVSSARSPQELEVSPWLVAEPGSGEVTIAVKSSAVNFPDALCVQGLYPTLPEYPFVPGFEVAGTLVRIGPEVTGLSLGDEVIAVTGMQLGGHASRVNVAAVNVVRKPAAISFEEACAIPIAFSTVSYAFGLAKLVAGESVLIQTASGGCGLAAIQLARLRGCCCYATAGRPEKLDVLRRIGIDDPINYRTARFDLEIRRMTRGRGVDAVLNMLAGQAIQQGLDCLAPFGRYLELAVHALRGGTQLDLSRLVQNQSFHSIDLRRLSAPKWLDWRSSLEEVVALAESNEIASIVSRIYPVRQAHEALRFVAEGRHIGKVVISHTATQVVDRTEQCLQGLEAQRRRCAQERSSVGRAHSVPSRTLTAAPQIANMSEGIAVIGMAGQFPGARSTAELWSNILSKRDSIAEVPRERWPIEWFYDPDPSQPGKTYSKWLGALQDIDCFDAAFFNIAPAEAKWMDPQQRLFLQNCWHCIEDAGIDPHSLAGSRCGVFVGCAQGDYDLLGAASGQVAESLTGGTTSILSARFSYFLNLKGPCVAIDTACSSALVAIAQACDSLILGGSDLALAGGVYVRVGPGMHVMTSKAGMLSRQGRCHTFDNRADGFVPGEGVGLFLLKRHAEAVRDGDPIHAVIRGWGVNHDGRTNGITAPSASSQTLLEKDVYARFQIDPRTISLVEAHGTATKLGDPIEVEALTDAFRSYTDQKRFCALGSVKSNVGHLMIAAAVPAVVKAILALQQRMLPPTLHFAAPNEHIDLENSPFYVNTECRDWNEAAGSRRRAAVSSFGFSGTNAHVVLEEHRTDSREDALSVPDGSAPALIVLSARTAARLAARAGQLLSALETGAITDADLANAAYTLQLGRAAFEHRLALAVISVDELRCKLVLYQAGEEVPGLHRGETSRRVASGQLSAASVTSYAISDAPHILQQWVHGGAVDWQRISEGQRPKPRRIRVPLYPFASERHWHINAADVDPTVQPSAQAPVPRTGGATAAAQSAMNDAISSPDPADRAGFVAPRTELERLIAGIWEAVLELPCVGVEDSFLELGGHSLNGVHVIKRIREEFGVELPMGALIDVHSTVAALAVVLVSELASQTDAQALGEQLQRMESA